MKRSLRANRIRPGSRPVIRFVCLFFAACFVLAALSFVTPPPASAQGGAPENQPERGMIFNGLERSARRDCRPGYEFHIPGSKRPLCTHGPDPSPLGTNVKESAAPVAEMGQAAPVVCDADGQSGNRVQVLYARASDKPDRFATYEASIQAWAAEADAVFSVSAQQTGGDRHVRYVHDSACQVIVTNVVLPPEGDDSIPYTVTTLANLGYNRSDRKYLIFMDATYYCGIATMLWDDSPFVTNAHNKGAFYARVDAGCWGGGIAAHELMHTLGGVQITAPHSTGNFHCTDESDKMCYQDGAGVVLQYNCDSTNEARFDCNHDDYYNTNPPPGSYLATYWNTANNLFLIGAVPLMGRIQVDSLATGSVSRKGIFTLDDTFKRGSTVTMRGHLRDQNFNALGGVQTNLQVLAPDGSVPCELTLTSDGGGAIQGDCILPRKAPLGGWQVQVAALSKTYYAIDPNSITSHPFDVTVK